MCGKHGIEINRAIEMWEDVPDGFLPWGREADRRLPAQVRAKEGGIRLQQYQVNYSSVEGVCHLHHLMGP